MVADEELFYSKLRLVLHPPSIEVRHATVASILPTAIGIGISVLVCLVAGTVLILDNAFSRGLQWLISGSLLFAAGTLLWHQSQRPVILVLNPPERKILYKTLFSYRTISFSEVQDVCVEGPRLRSYYRGPYYRKEWCISLRLVMKTGKRKWLFTSYHHEDAKKDVRHELTELRTLASMVNELLEQHR